MKKYFLALTLTVALLVSGCKQTADDVSYSISHEADRFNIPRRIRIYNTKTGKIVYETQGLISVKINSKKLDIIIKEGKLYKKHIVGLNGQLAYVLEDLEGMSIKEVQ